MLEMVRPRPAAAKGDVGSSEVEGGAP
jgi:hypothetical protein